MIKINLSKLLGDRRWTQRDLARKTGIRPTTIGDMYHELVERVNLDHLDRICEALCCDVSELLEYIPNKGNKIFAKRVKQLRESKGLNVRQLARQIGRTQNLISGIENGSRDPTPQLIKLYADFFEVSYKYLTGIDE